MNKEKMSAGLRVLREKGFAVAWRLRQFVTRREEGATLVEYALLVALIAIACITAIALLGNDIANAFNNIGSKINNNT